MPELLFILVLALLIFGPKRLPQVGRTLGKGLREFRQATNELKRTVETEISAVDAEPLRPTPAPLPAPNPALETETSTPVPRPVSAPAVEPVAGGDAVQHDMSEEVEGEGAEVKEAVAAAGEAPTDARPTD